MAGKKLAQHVHVQDETGRWVVLVPGDTVPAWAKDQVTNPKAFEADKPDGAEGAGDKKK